MLFGQEHVERYRETGGAVGHEWQPGVFTLLLTTIGRRSGEPFTTPLIYTRDGDDLVVIASRGGDSRHPDWYHNLQDDPGVEVQVGADVFPARASTVDDDDRRARLWRQMAEVWPDYDEYVTRTDRHIPVVVLTPTR